jgi:hypothetical protein
VVRIEIRATYPATDGSMPEDVTVEIVTEGAVVIDPMQVDAVLQRLIGAPSQVAAKTWTSESLNPTPGQVARAREDEQADPCRRLVCGHGRLMHGRYGAHGNDLGMGNGACLACRSSERCAFYVEAKQKETT